MGLGIKNVGNGKGYVPVLICDDCGEIIENTKQGIVYYVRQEVGAFDDINIFHKGDCDPGRHFWMQLDNYLKMMSLIKVGLVANPSRK
jgi:hypothetical protein